MPFRSTSLPVASLLLLAALAACSPAPPELTQAQKEWVLYPGPPATAEVAIREHGYRMLGLPESDAGRQVEWGWKVSAENLTRDPLCLRYRYRLSNATGEEVATDQATTWLRPHQPATLLHASTMPWADLAKVAAGSLSWAKADADACGPLAPPAGTPSTR